MSYANPHTIIGPISDQAPRTVPTKAAGDLMVQEVLNISDFFNAFSHYPGNRFR